MKKTLLLSLFVVVATSAFAAKPTATFVGTEISRGANGNWYFEGYKQDNNKLDCGFKASFQYDIRRETVQAEKNSDKIMSGCKSQFDSDNYGGNENVQCIVKAEYKMVKGERMITKVISAQEKPGKVSCN